MAKITDVDVTVYEVGKKLKAMASFCLEDLVKNGKMPLNDKAALQQALVEALSSWEFE